MHKFLDGPAAGKWLSLSRAPLFLRVVQAADGRLDGLDQLDDSPEPGERVFAYRKVSDDGTCHIDFTDKRGRRHGRWEQMVTYAVVAAQPDEATLCDATAWRSWCELAYAAEKGAADA